MEQTETIMVLLGKKERDPEFAKHWRKLVRKQETIGTAKVDAFRALIARDIENEAK